MKTWDVVIVGAGIIGICLALELRKRGTSVLIVEKNEPGREASHAAAGMLAHCEQNDTLRHLSAASFHLYPEFIQDIEDESGVKADFRTDGTLLLFPALKDEPSCENAVHLTPEELASMEPNVGSGIDTAIFLPEASVDPRALCKAALKAARHRGVEFSSGDEVIEIEATKLGASGVVTTKTRFPAAAVVNCAGAWAGQIPSPLRPPTRPVKGHMLDVIPASRLLSHGQSAERSLLRHVIRTPDVYIVPRTDGRIVIGSTVEEAGYNKRVAPDIIQKLLQSAANVCPELGEAKLHESWTGLRPGTPDDLPILGATDIPGYHIATGHFRDGILLAPITGRVMAQLIGGEQPAIDLSPFSPNRFPPSHSPDH